MAHCALLQVMLSSMLGNSLKAGFPPNINTVSVVRYGIATCYGMLQHGLAKCASYVHLCNPVLSVILVI